MQEGFFIRLLFSKSCECDKKVQESYKVECQHVSWCTTEVVEGTLQDGYQDNLTQITCKHVNGTFPGPKSGFYIMRMNQCEVSDKLWVKFLAGLKDFSRKKSQHISGRNIKNFDFSSCATYFRFRSVLVDTLRSVKSSLIKPQRALLKNKVYC